MDAYAQRKRHAGPEDHVGGHAEGGADRDQDVDADRPAGGPAEFDRVDQPFDAVVGEDHVAGFERGVAPASAHADGDVGRGKSRGVVDPVADHRHDPAFGREASDRGHLGVGREGGAVGLDADLTGGHGGGLLAVPRQHHRADLAGVQGGEGGGAARADLVHQGRAHGDGSVGGPDFADDGAGRYGGAGDLLRPGELAGADAPAGTVEGAGDALAG